ncbi:MAG: hypothetical protein AAGE86_13650 [Pseudomonadota bacterium]
MFQDRTAAKSFWSSKVGQAAIASIAATTAMIMLSTQIQPAQAHSAALTQDSVMVEIA